MEEYSSEEVELSLADFSPTVRREYSSFGERSSLLSEILAPTRDERRSLSSLYIRLEREREDLFVFFFRSREEASKSLLLLE